MLDYRFSYEKDLIIDSLFDFFFSCMIMACMLSQALLQLLDSCIAFEVALKLYG